MQILYIRIMETASKEITNNSWEKLTHNVFGNTEQLSKARGETHSSHIKKVWNQKPKAIFQKYFFCYVTLELICPSIRIDLCQFHYSKSFSLQFIYPFPELPVSQMRMSLAYFPNEHHSLSHRDIETSFPNLPTHSSVSFGINLFPLTNWHIDIH